MDTLIVPSQINMDKFIANTSSEDKNIWDVIKDYFDSNVSTSFKSSEFRSLFISQPSGSISYDHQTVNPCIEIEQATSFPASLGTTPILEDDFKSAIYDEEIDYDVVVKMPPRRCRTITFNVLSRRKGKPSPIDEDDILMDI